LILAHKISIILVSYLQILKPWKNFKISTTRPEIKSESTKVPNFLANGYQVYLNGVNNLVF